MNNVPMMFKLYALLIPIPLLVSLTHSHTHTHEQIRRHNLGPALEWAAAHRGSLFPGDGGPSVFEFKLHSLAYLSELQTSGSAAALAYAQTNFGPFQVWGMIKGDCLT